MCESPNGKQRETQVRIRVAAGVREGLGRPGQDKQKFGEVVLGRRVQHELRKATGNEGAGQKRRQGG